MGGECDYICQEENAPLDLNTLTVDWRRDDDATLQGNFTCNDGLTLQGKPLFLTRLSLDFETRALEKSSHQVF